MSSNKGNARRQAASGLSQTDHIDPGRQDRRPVERHRPDPGTEAANFTLQHAPPADVVEPQLGRPRDREAESHVHRLPRRVGSDAAQREPQSCIRAHPVTPEIENMLLMEITPSTR